ncbi:hypothetical protein BED47_21825 [Gottfriedia luciferensis]|uniref:DUF4367 domain-containing protein n=1 Tax=Gottfriedia luciferensis TaxID=178774 RepID=A0ABX2ZTC8_9BACI|nr:DUF4367 domain-containing protein [Gottfriedia luciferensis]ODG91767.1 hypothetical protein BED47_21825 [Gottfriedia luciferensis]
MIIACLVLSSCKQNEKTLQHKNASKVKKIDFVALLEAPPDAKSASESAISEYEWHFKDKTTTKPLKSSIVNDVSIGNRSIVILNTQKIDNRFVVMNYKYTNMYNLLSFMDLNVKDGQYFTDKGGIKLPLNQFVVAKSTEPDDDPVILAFANKKKIAVIARYKRFSFKLNSNENKNISIVDSSGHKLFIVTNGQRRFLYFFDNDYIFVVTGNLNKNELINISDSLPSATSDIFPSSKNKN